MNVRLQRPTPPAGRAVRAASTLALVMTLACGVACTSSPAPPPPTPPPPQAVQAPPGPPAAPTESARSKQLTAEARWLAGLPGEPGAPVTAMEASPDWKKFAKEMDDLRSIQETKRMAKLKPWADVTLADARRVSESLLYPFGGPDAVYPTTLFPAAKTYVLVGLESCGKEIDPRSLSPKEVAQLLDYVLPLVKPFYQASYFITKDMEAELHGMGVCPVLMLFLAGQGASIVEVCPATLDESGKLSRLAPGTAIPKGSVRGLAVDFVSAPGAPVRTILYFSQNLADDGLAKHPEFVTFLGAQPKPSTYLKAASYLLWNRDFKTLRDLLLDKSLAVLEDDSGVPYRYFKSDVWDVKLFGHYVEPVNPFQRSRQADLAKAYEDPRSIRTLDFGLGYHRQPARCNLQFAIRKSVLQPPAQPPAQPAASSSPGSGAS